MAERKLARGTMLQRDSGGATWVTIAQATSMDGPAMSAEVFTFDDHEVPLGYTIKRKTTLDGGQVTIGLHFDPDDATHTVVFDDFEDLDEVQPWRLVYPGATNALSFDAMVVGFSPSAPVDGALTGQLTLEVSGPVGVAPVA